MLMLGKVSVEAVDAASLASVWQTGTLVCVLGVILGLDPLLGRAFAARDEHIFAERFWQGVLLAVLLSVPLGISWLFTRPALTLLGQDAHLAELAHRYVLVQLPSLPLLLIFFVLRQALQNRNVVRPTLFVVLIANVVHAAANAVLIYGWAGMPARGLIGAGMATAISQMFLCIALYIWMRCARHELGAWVRYRKTPLRGLSAILEQGIPVGVQYGLEQWAFQAMTLFVGRLGKVELAAHAIALNLVSLTYMVPLGISAAAATRTSHLWHAQRPRQILLSAWTSVGLGAFVMAFAALILLGLRWQLPRLYVESAAVIDLCAGVLPIAAAFQVFDGAQVVAAGVLRGQGRPLPALFAVLFANFVIAWPLAYWLTSHFNFGLYGVWWPFVIALGAVALLLLSQIGRFQRTEPINQELACC